MYFVGNIEPPSLLFGYTSEIHYDVYGERWK